LAGRPCRTPRPGGGGPPGPGTRRPPWRMPSGTGSAPGQGPARPPAAGRPSAPRTAPGTPPRWRRRDARGRRRRRRRPRRAGRRRWPGRKWRHLAGRDRHHGLIEQPHPRARPGPAGTPARRSPPAARPAAVGTAPASRRSWPSRPAAATGMPARTHTGPHRRHRQRAAVPDAPRPQLVAVVVPAGQVRGGREPLEIFRPKRRLVVRGSQLAYTSVQACAANDSRP
jgi:hypothetical protein